MPSTWQAYLIEKGARIEAGRVCDFGDPAAELQCAGGDLLCDLSHYGLLVARGEDARTFMQGQFTNDLRMIDDTHSQLSGYCSPKGRMMVNFRIFHREDAYYLRLPPGTHETTLKRLRMYVLRAKVTLDDASESLARVGASGPGMPALLQQTLGALPDDVDAVVHVDGITVIRVAGDPPRFELYSSPARIQSLWGKLSPQIRPVGAGIWSLLEIRAGLPTVYPENNEAFVPQMTNLQLVNGVNFKKGCYTGQEVVARMQYLGKLKRRMYRARIAGTDCPKPGDELFSPESVSGQGTGRIVDAQPSPDGGCELLAVVQISSVEAGEVRLRDAEGARLEFLDLPYPFEPASLTEESI